MKIIVSGKHMDVGDALTKHIEDTCKSVVEKYFGDILEVHAYMSKGSYQFTMDLSFHVSRHFVVRGHSEDADPYRCFDLALEKVQSRIQRYKSRLRNRKRHDTTIEMQMEAPALDYVINGTAEQKEESDNPVIIAEMDTIVPTYSVSDAVMHLDLTEQPVMMFKNSKNGHMNVVYRRNDGNIGWIDPSTGK